MPRPPECPLFEDPQPGTCQSAVGPKSRYSHARFLSTHRATPERIADTLRYADEIAGKQ